MRTPHFMTYTGSKYKLAPWIRDWISRADRQDYVECFCGSGAVFFEVRPEKGILCDVSNWTLEAMKAVRDFPGEVRDFVKKYSDELYEGGKPVYLKLRDEYDGYEFGDPKRGASHLCLSHSGFNGLTRFDKNGKWNVAFGIKYDHKVTDVDGRKCPRLSNIVDDVFIKYYSSLLQKVEIVNSDYQRVVDWIGDPRKTVLYMDPPYSQNENSRGCYGQTWTDNETQRLFSTIELFVSRGGVFFLSNTIEYKGERNEVLSEWVEKNGFQMDTRDYKYVIGGGRMTDKVATSSVECLVTNLRP